MVGSVVESVLTPLLSAVIGAVALVLLQRLQGGQRWFVFRPLRRAAKDRAVESQGRALQEALWAPGDARGAATVIAAVDHPNGVSRSTAVDSAAVLRALSRPGAHGLVTRLLYREQEEAVKERANAAVRALAPFERGIDLAEKQVEKGLQFARWASAISGAAVMVDSLNSRSRVAHDVYVWHSNKYRGHPQTVGTSYDSAHQAGCVSHDLVQRAGDYDGRVMNLDACSIIEDASTGSLSFALETSESCYAATEQGDQPWGCKHLPSHAVTAGLRFDGRSTLRRVGDRLCLLTSYVALLTGDQRLVLCMRSRDVRSGAGVLSASAGGVCQPGSGAPGAEGDRDQFGWPDPIQSAQRELHEELGVHVDRRAIRPAALFLANSWNPNSNSEGQIVATLLSVARVTSTFDSILGDLWSQSDLAAGRFEVEDILPISMRKTAEHFVDELSGVFGDLDQHGLLSAVYSSAAVWGRPATVTAFDSLVDRLGTNAVRCRALFEPSSLIPRLAPR